MQNFDAQKVRLHVIGQLTDICENLKLESGNAEKSLAEASRKLNQLAAMMVDPVGASAGPSTATVDCPHCTQPVTVKLSK